MTTSRSGTMNRPQRGATVPSTALRAGRVAWAAALAIVCALVADASPAAAQHPFPTPPRRPDGARMEGVRPTCALSGASHVSSANVAVGQPVTVTFTSEVSCPQQLHHAALLVIVGAVDAAQLAGVRDALGVLLTHHMRDPAGQLALIQLSDPDAPMRWARTSAERHAISDLWWRWPEQPPADAARWASAAARAEAMLTDLPPTLRPVLAVIDGQAPADATRARGTLTRLMTSVDEAAGLSIVVDASPNRWLFAPTLPLMVDSVVATTSATRIGMESVVHAFDGPLTEWRTTAILEGSVGLVEGSVAPPDYGKRADLPHLWWNRSFAREVEVHRATSTFRFTLIPSVPASVSSVVVLQSPRRAAEPGPQAQPTQSAHFCVYPPDIGPNFCLTPTVTPTPEPTERRPLTRAPTPTPEPWRLRGRVWLPAAAVARRPIDHSLASPAGTAR